MTKLFSIIDTLSEDYVSLLIKLCNIESKSENKEGLDQIYEEIIAHGRTKGYEIKEMRLEKAGNVASLTYYPKGKGALVCLSAHADTVFEKGEFGYPPVKREGDLLIGPGVIDCKGGIAVSLLTLDALRLYGYDKRPVRFILQSDEEVQSVLSGKKTLEFMQTESAGARAFFNCEGRNAGFVTTKRKGIIRLCLEIKGRAAHAGDYFEGASAIREAAHKILNLETLSVKDGVTYNCGVISGGSALNVVPDFCNVYIDVRINGKDEYDKAITQIQKVADTAFVPGTKCEMKVISDRSPMERTEGVASLFHHIAAVSQKYGFGPQKEFASNGGSDAAYAAQAGIPTVDDMGPIGGKYHTKDEWCLVPSVAESAKLIAASIVELVANF